MVDYKSSGVDRDRANAFVENIQKQTASTKREGANSDLGGYGGFFEAPKSYTDPVWVATTDGVGTKLLIAEKMIEKMGASAHRGIGQDVVAMCVNDLVACGAEPVVFLDYLATGKIHEESLSSLIEGISNACKETGCALVGGETAEMPGFYANNRYDVAGFSVGVMERDKRLKKENVRPGDLIIGFASDGFHSNGYSLVRKILDDQKWSLNDEMEGQCLGEYLTKPTRLYVKDLLEVFRAVDVKGAAHITGGGLIENLPRCLLADKTRIVLHRKAIDVPAVMNRFVEAGKMDEREAFSTWNMGIGFCAIIDSKDIDKIKSLPLSPIELGYVDEFSSGKPTVILEG